MDGQVSVCRLHSRPDPDRVAGDEGAVVRRWFHEFWTPIPHAWRWRAVTVWIVVFTAAVAWTLLKQQHATKQGRQAKAALCAFKHDIEVRVASSREFLREHPGGIAGIPVVVIASSINNEQATVDALTGVLNCKEGP